MVVMPIIRAQVVRVENACVLAQGVCQDEMVLGGQDRLTVIHAEVFLRNRNHTAVRIVHLVQIESGCQGLDIDSRLESRGRQQKHVSGGAMRGHVRSIILGREERQCRSEFAHAAQRVLSVSLGRSELGHLRDSHVIVATIRLILTHQAHGQEEFVPVVCRDRCFHDLRNERGKTALFEKCRAQHVLVHRKLILVHAVTGMIIHLDIRTLRSPNVFLGGLPIRVIRLGLEQTHLIFLNSVAIGQVALLELGQGIVPHSIRARDRQTDTVNESVHKLIHIRTVIGERLHGLLDIAPVGGRNAFLI